MRPLFALLVATSVLGGMQLYMMLRAQAPAMSLAPPVAQAAGAFAVELTLTFDAGPDPFALDAEDAPSLLVLLQGETVLQRSDPIAAGTPLRVEAIKGVQVGANEFFVQVNPQDASALVARAVRVRVLRNDRVLASKTLWSEPGEPVQGRITVVVPATAAPSTESSPPGPEADHA